ncbi:hypothetical protein J6590_055717 [Homalodisca vitripennis]|nr:hypothetical protein J6590_055717 [Homalodisca vitripennis]
MYLRGRFPHSEDIPQLIIWFKSVLVVNFDLEQPLSKSRLWSPWRHRDWPRLVVTTVPRLHSSRGSYEISVGMISDQDIVYMLPNEQKALAHLSSKDLNTVHITNLLFRPSSEFSPNPSPGLPEHPRLCMFPAECQGRAVMIQFRAQGRRILLLFCQDSPATRPPLLFLALSVASGRQ